MPAPKIDSTLNNSNKPDAPAGPKRIPPQSKKGRGKYRRKEKNPRLPVRCEMRWTLWQLILQRPSTLPHTADFENKSFVLRVQAV